MTLSKNPLFLTNDGFLRQMNKVKNSKGVSGSGICERGVTLADFETAYYYQIYYERYFWAFMIQLLLNIFMVLMGQVILMMKKWEQSQHMVSISYLLRENLSKT